MSCPEVRPALGRTSLHPGATGVSTSLVGKVTKGEARKCKAPRVPRLGEALGGYATN